MLAVRCDVLCGGMVCGSELDTSSAELSSERNGGSGNFPCDGLGWLPFLPCVGASQPVSVLVAMWVKGRRVVTGLLYGRCQRACLPACR